jgi:hypothetical protein
MRIRLDKIASAEGSHEQIAFKQRFGGAVAVKSTSKETIMPGAI